MAYRLLTRKRVALEAGKIMLQRINELLVLGDDFAIETTLTTRSYVSLIQKAKKLGYKVSLIYIWLSSPQLAIERVAERVKNGGHNIPTDVIERRYYRGVKNLFEMFMPVCDYWTIVDNSEKTLLRIARKNEFDDVIENLELWQAVKQQSL